MVFWKTGGYREAVVARGFTAAVLHKVWNKDLVNYRVWVAERI